jgi:hypothetical protein
VQRVWGLADRTVDRASSGSDGGDPENGREKLPEADGFLINFGNERRKSVERLPSHGVRLQQGWRAARPKGGDRESSAFAFTDETPSEAKAPFE